MNGVICRYCGDPAEDDVTEPGLCGRCDEFLYAYTNDIAEQGKRREVLAQAGDEFKGSGSSYLVEWYANRLLEGGDVPWHLI